MVGFRRETIAAQNETDAKGLQTPVLQARSHVFRSTWRSIGLATIESMLREITHKVFVTLTGVEKVLNNDCETGIFADDIVLWSSGSGTENPSKPTMGFFTTNRKLYNFRPRIPLNSQPLEIEKHPRYLGFILDPEILSNRHLEHLALRSRERIKILKYISGRDWGADAGHGAQRLKRGSPLGHVVSGHLVVSSIEHHSLSQIIDPLEGLDVVYFHVDLSIQISKQKELPCNLKQLALERINNVHKDAVHMYTDGSKHSRDCSGSGIYISFRDQEIKIQRKNPVSCSVFRSELVAILEGLKSIESLPQLHDICIFSDSRSPIQHLANWHNVRDRKGTDILKMLKRLSLSRQIHFQWIPSHVNISGNEIADSLARAGAGETTTPAAPLTYLELFSKYKAKDNAIWMIPPVHLWYHSKHPGGFLVHGSSRQDPTALTRFFSGHLISLTFVDGIKNFEICTKCSSAQTSPGHISSCLGLTRQDLVQDPL
ncbi:RNase H domain-containing protein [Trichonephila clavipes]|uniref:ribonuclease H n=1 Tax=Trichonephila clavipes TaxID=2585209 RepID=A0A8X6R798_TRICX|nr:RNase H domain-containing protein [Trichonephila clavipes]